MNDTYGIDRKSHLTMPQRGGAPFPNGFGALWPSGANGDSPGQRPGARPLPQKQKPQRGEPTVGICCPVGANGDAGFNRMGWALHTQGVALGYRRLCRWHRSRNEDAQGTNETKQMTVQMTGMIPTTSWHNAPTRAARNAPTGRT